MSKLDFFKILAALLIACFSVACGDDRAPVAATEPAPADSRTEFLFISAMKSLVPRYKAAPNEFLKSNLRTDRSATLARLLPNPVVMDWAGTIDSMSTNSDGNGLLSVRLSDSLRLEATDTFAGDGVVIPHGSPVYEQVAKLAVGDAVVFSGKFILNDRDYVRELSITEEGSMADPEFLFTFTGIRPAEPRKPISMASIEPRPVDSGSRAQLSEPKINGCLNYAPSPEVTINGTISRKAFTFQNGNEPETIWILSLDDPICTNSGTEPEEGAEGDVIAMQLLFTDSAMYDKYRDQLGKPVAVTGYLFHALSSHHHTSVMLQVKDITAPP